MYNKVIYFTRAYQLLGSYYDFNHNYSIVNLDFSLYRDETYCKVISLSI